MFLLPGMDKIAVMKYSDIIIIGGGAAGLMAAIGAGSAMPSAGKGRQQRVTVLEKMPRPGRKIMITGKGRCNFTNVKSWNEFSSHINPAPGLLKPAFYSLTPEKLSEMFVQAGLETVVERGDRAFPASHRAADVVDTLAAMARKAGADIICGKETVSIRPPENHTADDGGQVTDRDVRGSEETLFRIECADGSSYCCRRLIIATGGLSYPASGSTGDGLMWARQNGLAVRPTFPSLTAIVPDGYKATHISRGRKSHGPVAENPAGRQMRGHIDRSTPLSARGRALAGICLKNTGLTVKVDGCTVCDEFGDIEFTDGGLEGPLGFRVSRKCVNAIINGSKVSVCIDLKPAVSLEELEARISRLQQEIAKDRRSTGKDNREKFMILLGRLMPRELTAAFLLCNQGVDTESLARTLKCWKMDIAGYVGYERCVITAGGIDASEIVSRTMECRKIPGLYFAGEILDLDGDTGGYNLHIAFATGCLAGQSAAGSISQDRAFPSPQA